MGKKRGSILDFIFWIPVIFLVLFTAVITHYAFDVAESVNSTYLNKTFTDQGKQAMVLMDTGLIVLLVLGFITLVLFIITIKIHPVFLIPVIFLIGIMLILAAQFSNAYEEVVSIEVIENSTSEFPVSNRLMENYPAIILMLVVILIIIMFSRGRIV